MVVHTRESRWPPGQCRFFNIKIDPNYKFLYFVINMRTKIVILAAGKGTRMGADVPKPLVEVSGRPMILQLLENIQDSKVKESPVLVVSPDGKAIFEAACEKFACEFAVQQEQLGTGHAVESALEAVGDADAVIVLYGDHPFISAEIINKLVELYETHKSAVTILTAKLPNFKGDYSTFEKWGRIIRSNHGKIEAVREYKDATEEEREIPEVNPGIYIFDRQWLSDHLAELSNNNASQEYYLTDLIEMAIAEGSGVITSPVENPFEVMGINTPEELERAERIMG
jgi:bifunctional UDP-N-acetylglucosamine pyrophosphorylase/glucosamine-1-phosphate N-acetyltransferase